MQTHPKKPSEAIGLIVVASVLITICFVAQALYKAICYMLQ